jgi:hypothetical protein
LFDVTIEAIENRGKLRNEWKQRLKDSIFKTLEQEARPFKCEMLEENDDVEAAVVRDWRGAFVSKEFDEVNADAEQKSNKKRKRKDKTAGLTKKEKKRTASNWERMKKKIK